MSNADRQMLREEFQFMQDHYSDPADRGRQIIYIAAEALLDELESAERRIAELEGNEIREEDNQFLIVRHPGKIPVIKHCTGDIEEFLRRLIEQDPLVTIDIVTHRYYGVGGQWVQDADEYLHAAGIKIKGE